MRRTVETALMWGGTHATISLFVVSKSKLNLNMSWEKIQPIRVTSYHLEDLDRKIKESRVFQFDAVFEILPIDLEVYLRSCLEEAMNKGAELAWFGFEGSFDYEYLLAPEIAAQIYALADSTGVAIAVEDQVLNSDAWRERVAAAKARILR